MVINQRTGLRQGTIAGVVAMCLCLVGGSAFAEAEKSHGVSIFGDLKYPADFTHFEYTNPDAPKGGSVRLSALGSFDTLNAFILKGVAAAGISGLYDSLIVSSDDEVSAGYGLVAHTIEVPEDTSWATFYLRPEARWHDGEPLTAEDVAWTFDTMTTKGHPVYRSYYSSVEAAEVIDEHTVKFTFKEKNNSELPVVIGQMSILPKHYYEEHEFEKTTMDPPLGSGPYKIVEVDAGRSITYELVDDYWAVDLPVKRGVDNFKRVRHDYYRDLTVGHEALKAGDVDFRLEYISKNWKTAYDFPALNEGRVIKEDIPDGSIQVFQGWLLNLRKEKYQDIRVRKALGLAFDFEWMNKNLFYDAYKRVNSYFQNSELASTGLPSGGELALLEEYRDELDPAIFTEEFVLPKTDGKGNPRRNYREALALLKEAGWEIKDGKLTNVKSGEKFTMDFITRQPGVEKIALTYKKSLERIGIDMNVRVIDTAQWVKLAESFEFDFATTAFAMPLSPGNEQRTYFGSEAADLEGSRNFSGIKNPVVDALIEKIIKAPDREAQVDATRALDRVLKHNHYMIPQYFGDTHRVAYWNKFSRPEIQAKHALGFNYWWVDPEKDAALKK